VIEIVRPTPSPLSIAPENSNIDDTTAPPTATAVVSGHGVIPSATTKEEKEEEKRTGDTPDESAPAFLPNTENSEKETGIIEVSISNDSSPTEKNNQGEDYSWEEWDLEANDVDDSGGNKHSALTGWWRLENSARVRWNKCRILTSVSVLTAVCSLTLT